MTNIQPMHQEQVDHQQVPESSEEGKRPPLVQQSPHAEVHFPPHPAPFDPVADELDDPVGDRSGRG